jgi:ribosomal protein S18 acetylase RimI-like enzyme
MECYGNRVYHCFVLTHFDFEEMALVLESCLPDDVFIRLIGRDLMTGLVLPYLSENGKLFTRLDGNKKLVAIMILGHFSFRFVCRVVISGSREILRGFRDFKRSNFKDFFAATLYLLCDTRNSGSIEIMWIAVQDYNRGIGIGSRLLRDLDYYLAHSDYDYVVVKTLVSTPKNIRFYEKAGFKIILTRFGRVKLLKEKSLN